MQLDLANPRTISLAAVRTGCQERQRQQLLQAAERDGASKMQHYVIGVCGGSLDATSLSKPAAYLTDVRERSRREALAQWRTGSHWGAEETGRWQQIPREQRLCPHCGGGTETVSHMIFDCPLYAQLRIRFADLFQPSISSLHAFLQQPPPRLASFAAACRREWQNAVDSQTHPPPPTTPA